MVSGYVLWFYRLFSKFSGSFQISMISGYFPNFPGFQKNSIQNYLSFSYSPAKVYRPRSIQDEDFSFLSTLICGGGFLKASLFFEPFFWETFPLPLPFNGIKTSSESISSYRFSKFMARPLFPVQLCREALWACPFLPSRFSAITKIFDSDWMRAFLNRDFSNSFLVFIRSIGVSPKERSWAAPETLRLPSDIMRAPIPESPALIFAKLFKLFILNAEISDKGVEYNSLESSVESMVVFGVM